MDDNIANLESELEAASKRFSNALHQFLRNNRPEHRNDCTLARAELLALERRLSAAKGEPYAISADFPVEWDTGAPLPFLLASEYRTYLAFYVRDPDPNWDGTYVNVVDPSSPNVEKLCIVTIGGCVATRFGSPNEEVFHGHYLYGHGQEAYEAQIVMNSPWLREVQAINSVHSQYNPNRWTDVKHFILWFHDSTFECLAKSLTPEIIHDIMPNLLTRLAGKLVS